MPSDKNITLVVVVGGVDQTVTVNPNQDVKHLVKEALRTSGQPDEPPENWVLRTVGGDEIPQSGRVRDVAAITAGVKLFLSQSTGGGG